MKQSTIITIAAVAAGLLFIKKRSASGVGAINPYIAISELQRRGVDLSIPYNQMPDDMKSRIYRVAQRFGYKQTAKSRESRTYEEAFIKAILPTYNKAVAGIGDPETDDYTPYPIVNENGETVLVYHDIKNFPMIDVVKEEWDIGSEGLCRTADEAYKAAICYIAGGNKFIWSDEKYGGGVKQELFASRHDPTGERRARISILASKEKGGVSIKRLAEQFSSQTGNDAEARDGICQAVMDFETPKQAKEAIREEALRRVEENRAQYGFSVNYDDVPF